MTTSNTPEAPTGPIPVRNVRRWMWIALIASLAVNLFVVGVVARSVWPFRYAVAGGGGGGLAGNLAAYMGTLPESRRKELRAAMGQARPHQLLRPFRVELRWARQEAAAAFKAEPFNRDVFLAAEGRVQAAEARLRDAIVKLSADMAGRLTADERAGFLKWRDVRRGGGAGPQADRDLEKDAPPKKSVE